MTPDGPPDLFTRILSDGGCHDDPFRANPWFIAGGFVGVTALVMTFAAAAGGDGSGLWGIALFVTGPMMLVGVVLAVVGGIVSPRSPGPAVNTSDLIRASNGQAIPSTADVLPRPRPVAPSAAVFRRCAIGLTIGTLALIAITAVTAEWALGYMLVLFGAPMGIAAGVLAMQAAAAGGGERSSSLQQK